MSFFFSFLSFSHQIERERVVYKIWVERRNSPKVDLSYFSTGFHWRIFLLLRANRLYAIFNTGLKNLGPSCLRYSFVFYPAILALVRLPATNPAKQLTFLLSISADGKESPLPFWGPSQSFGFSLPPPGRAIS